MAEDMGSDSFLLKTLAGAAGHSDILSQQVIHPVTSSVLFRVNLGTKGHRAHLGTREATGEPHG